MKEHPILFGDEMVRAILSGRKTQTRRPCKVQPAKGWEPACYFTGAPQHGWSNYRRGRNAVWEQDGSRYWPRYAVGDRLWVRETFRMRSRDSFRLKTSCDEGLFSVAPEYRATTKVSVHGPWSPSIHMPRCASRITLEITATNIHRLRDINEIDCYFEGRPLDLEMDPVSRPGANWFRQLWDNIYAKRGLGWDSNPVVEAYTFVVVC